ncbi:unnamed protein product [Symbiodinium sp. CCMP2592]|nr:unnamed protein product [Symbiodinium sp. CCMP2592]
MTATCSNNTRNCACLMGVGCRQIGHRLWQGEESSRHMGLVPLRYARTSASDRIAESPFPDFDEGLEKELDALGRPSLKQGWREEEVSRPGATKQSVVKYAPDELGDFILSLAVRRQMTGYALLRFRDLLPLQQLVLQKRFGLVDYAKHGADDVRIFPSLLCPAYQTYHVTCEAQQKGLEVLAVLRDLRQARLSFQDGGLEKLQVFAEQIAPQKLLQLVGESEDSDVLEEEFRQRQWKWVVAMDDSTIDRGTPKTVRESHAQRVVSMLQGLVIADCKRVFKSAPQVINPRRSRLHVGVRGGPNEEARKELFDIASKEVPDFPVIRYRSELFWQHFCGPVQLYEYSGTRVCNEWLRRALPFTASAARMAQRVVLLAQKREDQKLMAFLREQARSSACLNRAALYVPAEPQAIGSKPIKKLAQAESPKSKLLPAVMPGVQASGVGLCLFAEQRSQVQEQGKKSQVDSEQVSLWARLFRLVTTHLEFICKKVISELYPRRESKELSDVQMEKKIEAMVDEKLNKILNEALL